MRLKLLAWWHLLQRSFWFIPGLMAIGALLLAGVMVYLDHRLAAAGIEPLWFLPRGDAAGGRAILSTIASSTITVAGVVFSITIVVLSTAAAQFGPGLLPSFMNQRGTQVVLGGFIATFIYALLILAYIQEGEAVVVPRHALSLGVVFGVVSFGLLIFFIHYVAMFIQVPRVLDHVEDDLLRCLRDSFPARAVAGPSMNGARPEWLQGAAALTVASRTTGYLQAIDYRALVEQAAGHDLYIRTRLLAGDYVLRGQILMQVHAFRPIAEDVVSGLRGCYLIGEERTPAQDPLFAVDQIVEIALRALSPGINDPFTAMQCIDKLGKALLELADRQEPETVLPDAGGQPRLQRRIYRYEQVIDRALNQLRQYGAGHAAVAIRLMELLGDLSRLDLPEHFRDCLQRHAGLLAEDANRELGNAADRRDFERCYRLFSINKAHSGS